ncbi:MAG: rhodanese-like domain-containing protein [Gammaproteobacteria bacterium]
MQMTMEQMVAKARSVITEISVDNFNHQLPEHTVLIDVREPEEHSAGHIPGSLNIPRGVLEAEVAPVPEMGGETAAALSDKNRPICVYCRTGGRSAMAANALQEMGFTRVLSLAGGYSAWCEDRYRD